MSGGVYVFRSPSGKIYVGQTKDFRHRFWAHRNGAKKGLESSGTNRHLGHAIRKYGWSSFSITIHELPRRFWDCVERWLIKKFRSNEPAFGYNLTSGGEKSKEHAAETKAILSVRQSKRMADPAIKARHLVSHPKRTPAQAKAWARNRLEAGKVTTRVRTHLRKILGTEEVPLQNVGVRTKDFELKVSEATAKVMRSPEMRAKARLGGLKTGSLNAHVRWHLRRGIRNQNCRHCIKEG